MTTLPTLHAQGQSAPDQAVHHGQPVLHVNGKRLNQILDDLAAIGQMDNGGICRLAFSPEDVQGRELVRRWMIEAGMTVRLDTAGNIIGRLPGRLELPALATGSHIDTVPCGGKFDGCLGVLAGLEVARTPQQQSFGLQRRPRLAPLRGSQGRGGGSGWW